ncbi:hypothetical protein HPP92_019301 [Vanilla planifolia]|uniref:Uncharacterized protein n=1 Tax=Vanilla planifolia TaxID=51239 RepID=A0A835Q9B0_VANPL|nr:hypothetical protein HPP92_019301 [Vanilla planifolia]
MSWLKTAVNRAVEVSGKKVLGRTVRGYADSVVQQAGQAVAGGARIIQSRIGNLNYRSFKYTVRRLEEAAVSCRGQERVELLRRWLLALNEIERICGNSLAPLPTELSNLATMTRENSSLILFFDSDLDGEPLNFREVFLQSQALEGMIMSMILEEPNDEEVSLLQEIFGLCLTGGKEVHDALIRNIQDLAAAFTDYEDEVLVKREELLQFAQCAVSGLKLNADLARIDAEVSTLWQKIYGMEALNVSSDEGSQSTSGKLTSATIEALEEALEEVQLCSRLEELLLKKKTVKNGDTLETHSEKVGKLKVLAESLANSSSKAETRISDQRHQLEEALNFRVAKATEVSETEKGLIAEISELEKQKDDLEAELNKVNISLKASLVRLHKHREERNHFDEASNQIILHLKAKEDELLKSVASCKVEAHIVYTWISFLEDTWRLQSAFVDQAEKQTNLELENYGTSFVKLTKHHLLACKKELEVSVNLLKTLLDNIKNFDSRKDDLPNAYGTVLQETNRLKILVEEYLQVERKVITALIVVDHTKELFYAERDGISRRNDPQIEELFESIEKARKEFGLIERPKLDIKNAMERDISSENKLLRIASTAANSNITPRAKGTESPESVASTTGQNFYSAADLAKLDSDIGSPYAGYSSEDISGWEL